MIIAADEREAREAVDVFFAEKRFGETEVVLEEFLEGEELSLLALCDGERAVPLAPAQDYKRIFDGDEGPNTGGMGSYSPVPGHRLGARARDRRGWRTSRSSTSCAGAGTPFHGVLYAGLMMTAAGAEGARVQLPLRRPGDAGGAAAAALRPARAARGVGHARAASPASSPSGRRLGGDGRARLARLPGVVVERRRDHRASTSVEGAEVFHAGTAERGRRDRDRGRARAERDRARRDAGEARDRAYAAAERIEFDGKQMRTDIAAARGG